MNGIIAKPAYFPVAGFPELNSITDTPIGTKIEKHTRRTHSEHNLLPSNPTPHG